MKKIIYVVLTVIILVVAWYLISPFWRNVELNEASPLGEVEQHIIDDSFDAMDDKTRADFEAQLEEMRGIVIVEKEEMPSGAQIVAQGDFAARAHEVEGRALLIEDGDKKILRFENFNTINGPNLHIYLASSLSDDDFIDLGRIRATSGNVNYEVDSSVDTDKYDKVLVWCVPFNVLFSYADLN